jgi:hypothetical protein
MVGYWEGGVMEAPERIWVWKDVADVVCAPAGESKWEGRYIRADLAGLPEELVERLRGCFRGDSLYAATYAPEIADVLSDILRWHEQQKGEKE